MSTLCIEMAFSFHFRSLIYLLSLFLVFTPRCVSADTCATVESTHPDIAILYAHYLDYNLTVGDYWSTGCAALRPSCVLLPRSAQQVSNILKILQENNEPFSVKSGGHSPNKHFASIQGGPLIALKLLNEIVYHPGPQTVRVGPGNHWHNVSQALSGTGRNAVGGRMGDVGVGGYLLGGKICVTSSTGQEVTNRHRWVKFLKRGVRMGCQSYLRSRSGSCKRHNCTSIKNEQS
jgi:hypothetical protein